MGGTVPAPLTSPRPAVQTAHLFKYGRPIAYSLLPWRDRFSDKTADGMRAVFVQRGAGLVVAVARLWPTRGYTESDGDAILKYRTLGHYTACARTARQHNRMDQHGLLVPRLTADMDTTGDQPGAAG